MDKIAPLLGEFSKRYPEINLEMLLSNEPLDLIGGEIDVALRLGELPDSNLVARQLGVLHTQVFASAAYLDRHGEPQHPEELVQHRVLALTKHRQGSRYQWNLDDGAGPRMFQVDPALVVNDPAALKGALLCGEGLALTADVMVKPAVESGQVKRVLAGWKGADYPFSALFPRGHAQSPKVRAFVDFLLERLNLDIDYMSKHCPMSTCADAGTKAAAATATAAQSETRRAGRELLEAVTED
jgi:DNA-binding transcriptional LysR family regulator